MTERGSLLVSVVFLTAVAGLSAAALDVSNWYRANRKLQSGTDRAVLAGAQALPDNPRAARELVGDGDVTVSHGMRANDTLTLRRKLRAPGFFGQMLGGPRQVEAEATARAGVPSKTRWSSPLAVSAGHPALSASGCPCWNRATTVPVQLINLGASGSPESWIRHGFEGYMSAGWYSTASGPVRTALAERVGSELLLPVYRDTRERDSNVRYRVVGWTGFHLSGYDSKKLRLRGWFERVVWDGIQGRSGSEHDFGVRTVALIN